jgi:hypothetical protein
MCLSSEGLDHFKRARLPLHDHASLELWNDQKLRPEAFQSNNRSIFNLRSFQTFTLCRAWRV